MLWPKLCYSSSSNCHIGATEVTIGTKCNGFAYNILLRTDRQTDVQDEVKMFPAEYWDIMIERYERKKPKAMTHEMFLLSTPEIHCTTVLHTSQYPKYCTAYKPCSIRIISFHKTWILTYHFKYRTSVDLS